MALTRSLSAMVLTLLFLTALSVITKADTITLVATLSGANEVPPKNVTGAGAATVTLDTVTGKGTITVGFSGLTGAFTGGHIHCCAAPTANAGVIVPFDAFITPSANGTAGALANYAFTLTATQLAGMISGQAYVNIHTAANPGGEIRGQLIPVNAVPEPGTLLLLGAGLASVAGKLRKRRK